MMKRLRRHHGTLHAVFRQNLPDAGDNFDLPVSAHRIGWDHVSIMGGPMADTHLAEFLDHLLKSDFFARRCVKQSVASICGRPLRSGDEILAPRGRAVSASASFGEA